MMTLLRRIFGLLAGASFCLSGHQAAAFTYQGRLNDGPVRASGIYDFQFTLYDAATEGNLIGGTLTYPDNALTNGLFSVSLDFEPSSFDGQARWLEIAVRTNGAVDFATMSPRVQITPTPYALQALSVVSNGIAGTYQESVVFNNPANIFAGSFSGDGGGLTNVDAATWGGLRVTDFWQLSTNAAAATAAGATNVFAGGSVTTSNVYQVIPGNVVTNAYAFLAYGGLQLSGGYWPQSGNHRTGIEFMPPGWTTPHLPTDADWIPESFIHCLTQPGAGAAGEDLPVLHLASQGGMRLEPGYSSADVRNLGNSYLTLGNEDGNPQILVNYCNGSIYNHSTWPDNFNSLKSWVKGYSLPFVLWSVGRKNNSTYYSMPGIMGHAGDTNAASTDMGELWFYSRTPTADIWQPTIGEQNPAGVLVGKMLTNGWNFLGRLVLEQSAITADNGTNYVLDFNAASVSTIRLTSTLRNCFYVTNLVTAANEFEPRTYRILSGEASRPLRWPTNWSVVTESGTASLPTLLAAKKVLHLRLESWGPSESDIVARFAIGNDASN